MFALIVFAIAIVGAIVELVIESQIPPKLIVGDDQWDGTFARKAPKFRHPVYVYADGEESMFMRFDMPIVGYRAAPDLIVAVRFKSMISADEAISFAKEKHAKLPDKETLQLLLEHWEEINELKGVVEDIPLPEVIWVTDGEKLEVYSHKTQELINADKVSEKGGYASAVLLIER